jgi:hypothetical protein
LGGELLDDLFAVPLYTSEFGFHPLGNLQNTVPENGATNRRSSSTKLGIRFPEILAEGARRL